MRKLPILFVLLITTRICLASGLTNFILVDAQTNMDYYILTDNDTIVLANTPIISIRADVNAPVTKMEFYLDGVFIRSEGVAPYAINGDAAGDYNQWSGYTKDVFHEIKAYSYNGINIDDSLIINIVFVDTPNGGIPPSSQPTGNPTDTISGELRKWHRVTLTFPGIASSENDSVNPFLHYRFNVTFSNGNKSYVVPGFFAADGLASETSSDSGNYWRAHFCPDEEGWWNYTLSFASGINVAISDSGGTPIGFDGYTGSFFIHPNDKVAPDFRAKGRLEYVGEHYLRFRETGEYFIKNGTNSPENILGYYEFDNTINNGGPVNALDTTGYFDGLHHFDAHLQDRNADDPVWQTGKGKRLIGALNYLGSKKVNSIFVVINTLNAEGDDAHPWISYTERERYDVSKMEQWDIMFSHMDKLGQALHMVLSERENENFLDNGELGIQRKLYHRELIARFGYHLGICWDFGEENTNTIAQVSDYLKHLTEINPYNTFIVLHTLPGGFDRYTSFLGDSLLGGTSFQMQCCSGPNINDAINNTTRSWRSQSAVAGHKWVLYSDEVGPPETGLTPDGPGNNHDNRRAYQLWAKVMAGGAGSEYYYGIFGAHDDIDCEDFRSRDNFWNYTKYMIEFFENYIPVNELTPDNDITSNTNDYCFVKKGALYCIYIKDSVNNQTLNLESYNKDFYVQWYNPRTGGILPLTGSATVISGPGVVQLGLPPGGNDFKDWVILVRDAASIDISVHVTKNNNLCEGKSTGNISLEVLDGISPFTILWSTGSQNFELNSLSKGYYTFTITDNIGNSLTDSVFIDEPQVLQLTAAFQHPKCFNVNDGSAKIEVSGGTSPYTFAWSTSTTDYTNYVDSLSAGFYLVVVQDLLDCNNSYFFNLLNPAPITIQSNVMDESFPGAFDGSISLSVAGGQGPYLYQWNTVPTSTDTILENLSAGTYHCLVSDKTGCASVISVAVY